MFLNVKLAGIGLAAAWLPSAWAAPVTATSNASDWFGTSSGWSTSYVYEGAAPPTGSFPLDYKHWFAPPPPTAFSNFGNVPYPTAAAWGNNNFGTYELPESDAAGSQAISYWYISPYKGNALAPGFYAKEQTKSYANAKSPDTVTGSITAIGDPTYVTNPNADPNSQWAILDRVALFGDLSTSDGSSSFDYIFSLANGTGSAASAIPLLDIHVSGDHSTVTADSTLYNSGQLLFSAADGTVLTPLQIEADLDSSRTSTGWALDPSFDITSFQPDNAAELAQVFSLNVYVDLQNTPSATIYTDTYSVAISTADSPTPEPGSFFLLGLGLLGLAGCRGRRNRRLDGRSIGHGWTRINTDASWLLKY